MLIRCEKCQALYSLQDGAAQGQENFSVECGRCLSTFQAESPRPPVVAKAGLTEVRTDPARPAARLVSPRSVAKAPAPSASLEHPQKSGEDLARLLKPRRPDLGFLRGPSQSPWQGKRPWIIGALVVVSLAALGLFALRRLGGVSKEAQAKLARAHEKLLLDDSQSLEQASALYTEAAHLSPGEAGPEADRAFSLLLQAATQKELADRMEDRAKGLTERVTRLELDRPDGWEKQAAALVDQVAKIAADRDPHVREATRLLQVGLAAAKQALDEEPENASALRAMSFSCALSDAPDRATHFLEQAEKGAPGDALTAYARAATALSGSPSRARQDSALSALAQVRQREPGFLRADYDEAAISFDRQEFGPAREALQRLLKANPQHERGRQLLALLPAPQ